MPRLRRWVLLLLLASVACEAHAQDWRGRGRVDGWVKDPKGQPIAGAKIEFRRESGGGTSTTSNKKGYWAILGLIGGPWNVDISAPGYETRKISVNVTEAGRIPPLEIELEPSVQAAPAAPRETGGNKEILAAVEQGNKLLAEKKFAEARAQYEKALVAVPDNAALLKGIAQTYHGEGNKEKTTETLRKVAEADPNDTDNRALLASMLLENGQLDEGKRILENLPPGAIKDTSVYVNLGILFMNKKRPDDARAYLSKAVELDPTQAESYYYRGLASIQAKKNAEAKADLKKYLELAPSGPDAKEVREILQALK